MTISKYRVKPSPTPDSWKLREIFATGVVLGNYLAIRTLIFFLVAHKTYFFSETFGVKSIRDRSWSFVERPGALLMIAFLIEQLVATLIAVYTNWGIRKSYGYWMGCSDLAIQYYNILPIGHSQVCHSIHPKQVHISPEQGTYRELSEITEQAKRRAEITRSNKQVSQR
ncbi:unnamed protein product [Brassica oleracea]